MPRERCSVDAPRVWIEVGHAQVWEGGEEAGDALLESFQARVFPDAAAMPNQVRRADRFGSAHVPSVDHFFQEAADVSNLKVVVVLFGFGPELDFFQVDDHLLLLGFRGLLLLLVLVLAEVEDLAHRRLGFRVHLYEVEPLFLRALQRLVRGEHTEHLAVRVDDAHFGDANSVVHSNLKAALLLTRIEPRTTH